MPADSLRVLMTADAISGAWTFALDLARALAPRGVRMVIASMGPLPSAAQRRAAAEVTGLELVTREFRLEWMTEPWADVTAAGDWLLWLERRCHPDVVHINGFAHAALPFRAPVISVGHSCLQTWSDALPGAIDAGMLASFRHAAARGLRAARLVVAPSHSMLRALQEHFGPLERTLVIHNGRSDELFQPGPKEPFVMTAGRLWDRAKNADAVARVAPRLGWPTALVGESGSLPGGRGLSSTGVRVLGLLDDREQAEWLSRASIFALPARYEPFGLMPLEAALSGCALVLGDIENLREIWGDTAVFVDPDDVDGLAWALQALIDSRQHLERYAAAALGRAHRYSLQRMAAGYLEAYRRAASGEGSHGLMPAAS